MVPKGKDNTIKSIISY